MLLSRGNAVHKFLVRNLLSTKFKCSNVRQYGDSSWLRRTGPRCPKKESCDSDPKEECPREEKCEKKEPSCEMKEPSCEKKSKKRKSCPADDSACCPPKKKKPCAPKKEPKCCPPKKFKCPKEVKCIPPTPRDIPNKCPEKKISCGSPRPMCLVLQECCKEQRQPDYEQPYCDPVNLKRAMGPNDPVASLKKVFTPHPFFNRRPQHVPITPCDCDAALRIEPRFRRLKLLQARYQIKDGIPIFLKNGAFDNFLFNTTLGCCILGVVLCFRFYYDMAMPKANADED